MALNSGYQRFEGSAYFGYDMDGDGFDAVVIIGENVIEIRDLSDRPLSQWMPGSFICNNQEIPVRAYINGDEWLAPQDHELQEKLDEFVMKALPTGASDSENQRRFNWIWAVLVIVLVAAIAYFALSPLTKNLLSPAIRGALDDQIGQELEHSFQICNEDLNASTHAKIDATGVGAKFSVFSTITQNYARLPSGRLAINAEYLQNLGDVEVLASLLQLTAKKNESSDPAADIIAEFPIWSRLRFLADAEVGKDDLLRGWELYAQSEGLKESLYSEIPEPLGDYQDLSQILLWSDAQYPSQPIGLALTDEEWLSLFTFCEKDD